MAKVKINPQPLIGTTPTIIVGAMINGKPNFMTAAWCGIVNSTPPMISASIRPHRYTHKGMIELKEFSLNIPSVDQVMETDYCGIASGAKVDKVSDCAFTVFYGSLKNAPLIEQCPVNLVCKVEQVISLGSHDMFIGKVEETYVTETCLTDGKADLRKIRPVVFGMGLITEYFSFGESLGRAFTVKEMIKK
jgi:flavin reductase (DIM6/NTAB) family NADH-FMN oxidoreductase RutF